MSVASAKSAYARALREAITLRRYTGSGPSRPHFDAEMIRSRTVGYEPHELIGGVVQGDRKVIVLMEDIIARGFVLPVTINDKIVIRGKELAILAVDDSTRRVDGVLIAIELHVRG